jgi:site-specific recombinase XerD
VREWLRFANYYDDAGMDIPSGIHAPEVEDYLRQRLPETSQNRRFVKIALRIFIEADEQGDFSRRVHAQPKPTTTLFSEWVIPYVRFLREHRGLAEGTLQQIIFALREFMEFVDKRDIRDLHSLNAKHIHDFCSNSASRKPVAWIRHVSSVRCFLRYAFSQGGLHGDLSLAAEGTKRYSHPGLPDVLSESELNEIISCMDRSNAVGRRDAAILLLAARYGMRPSDIRQLRLDDLRWREQQITFSQSKTGKSATLPLLPEVAEALIDYLRAGRPATPSRNIFVRHKAPFEPFAPRSDLARIMAKALRRAGLDQRRGARGLYLFRHTLATRMLCTNTPIKTIGDILGHTSTNSTFGYTKVDVAALRSAALSIAEVLR